MLFRSTELIAEEAATYYERISTGDYELMVEQTWGAPYDPPTTIGGLKSKFGFLSCIKGLENYEMLIDDIDKLLKSTDETIRQQLYAKVLSKLHDDVAFIPLTYTKVTVIAPKNLTNIVFNQSMKEMPFEEFKFK